jgi:hypothetical protein
MKVNRQLVENNISLGQSLMSDLFKELPMNWFYFVWTFLLLPRDLINLLIETINLNLLWLWSYS